MTGDTLRRLIEEGEPAGGGYDRPQPSDAVLHDLAAALNLAASASPSRPREWDAHEAAAMAAFREAQEATGAAGRMRRRGRRDRLHRARMAALAGVTAAALGGGVAVAAAGGGIPLFGGTDRAAPSAAPTPEDLGPTPPATSAAPAEQTQPATGAAPKASRPGGGVDSGGEPGAADPEDRGAASGAAEANAEALRSLCNAHARNPHLAPRTLITAAGGRDRIGPYCEALLADPSTARPPAEDAENADKDADEFDGAPDPSVPVTEDDKVQNTP